MLRAYIFQVFYNWFLNQRALNSNQCIRNNNIFAPNQQCSHSSLFQAFGQWSAAQWAPLPSPLLFFARRFLRCAPLSEPLEQAIPFKMGAQLWPNSRHCLIYLGMYDLDAQLITCCRFDSEEEDCHVMHSQVTTNFISLGFHLPPFGNVHVLARSTATPNSLSENACI